MDINTLIDEQFDSMTAVSSDKILEAMLTRDSMELQYRKQGYSESDISRFHDMATQRILEASEDSKKWDSFGHAYRSADSKWGVVKNVAHHAWNKLVELFKKFWQWCKKIYLSIVNFFRSDANFIKKYAPQLRAAEKANKDIFNGIDVVVLKASDKKKALNYEVDVKVSDVSENNIDSNEKLMTKIRDGIDTEKKEMGKDYSIDDLISAFNTINIDELKHSGKEAEAKAKKLESQKELSEEDAKKSASYLHAMKAVNSFLLSAKKKQHSSLKSALIRCIARTKKVAKEATIMFMIEQSNIAIEEAYNPFHEADESEKDESREYSNVSGAWSKGDGTWNKIKGAAGAIGHNIIAFFKRCYDWIVGKFKAAWGWIKKQWAKVKVWWRGENKSDVTTDSPTVTENGKKTLELIDLVLNGKKVTEFKVMGDIIGINTGVSVFQVEKDQAELDQFHISVEKRLTAINNLIKKYSKDKNQKEFVKVLKECRPLCEELLKATRESLTKSKQMLSDITNKIRHSKNNNTSTTSNNQNAAEASAQNASALLYESAGLDMLINETIQEAYTIMAMAEADEVDPIIGSATNGSAYGITDVSQADTSILAAGASTDPFALDYEDVNTFSQTHSMGDEDSVGTVGVSLGDTTTNVNKGNQTPAIESAIAQLEMEFSCVA